MMLSGTLLLFISTAAGYLTPVRVDWGVDQPGAPLNIVLKRRGVDFEKAIRISSHEEPVRDSLLQPRNIASEAVSSAEVKNYRDQIHMTAIKLGTQEFLAVVDTGSTDTWIAEKGYTCQNPKGMDGCLFGPTYTKTTSFAAKPNAKFWTQYGGETVQGYQGTETVTLANITVKSQEVALVNSAVWKGDGVSSGLIGLGFPSNSASQITAKAGTKLPVPIFTSMHRQGLTAPYFSLALNRLTESPGSIVFGGLPTAPIKYSKAFAKAALKNGFANWEPAFKNPCGAAPSQTKPCKEIDYRTYLITIDGFTMASQPSLANKKMDVVIDSGTPTLNLPKDVAKAFNGAFSPPARFDRMHGWVVECTAKAPKLGIKISGTDFPIDPKDLILPAEKSGPGGVCTSGVQEGPSWSGGGLLGAAFLKNVVAVFDVGVAAEMRFAARVR